MLQFEEKNRISWNDLFAKFTDKKNPTSDQIFMSDNKFLVALVQNRTYLNNNLVVSYLSINDGSEGLKSPMSDQRQAANSDHLKFFSTEL